MLPLIQSVIDLIGLFFVVLCLTALAITASTILMRAIGIVSVE
jgi:hypothetical protein